ncbi:MAG TPA: hypothetical protein VFQ53_01075 [Kofleriaceae bacterium]|nr:hypothetical protein [Kofleriaceae bacterium]
MKLTAAALLALVAAPAAADPLRLRADALATTQSPVGLLVLDADATPAELLSAEAIVWTAASPLPGEREGDVLVIALRARTADGRGRGQLGRFVATMGALRPVHIDGGMGHARLPHRIDVEAYAGIPVLPDVGLGRTWDWVAAARIARRIGDYGSIGIAAMEQRDHGQIASEELGVDAGAQLDKRHDVAAKAAYDLANPGLAEVTASASRRDRRVRTELYATYRAASHLLPATSLFTVLGDVPSVRGGGVVTWRAAPRLDVIGDAAVRHVDDGYAPAIAARGRLRLDDRGTSALTGELRRDGSPDDAWTGARAALRIALAGELSASTELELVVPDHPRGRGVVWPWALAALGWDRGAWHAAVAVEASASPEDRYRLDALAQLGRTWGMP